MECNFLYNVLSHPLSNTHTHTHTHVEKQRPTVHTGSFHRLLTSLRLSLAVILMNDWRRLCWERARTSRASALCLPGSLDLITRLHALAKEAAAKIEVAVGYWSVFVWTLDLRLKKNQPCI